MFGVASIISPILLGIAFGVVTEGGIRLEHGQVETRAACAVAVALLRDEWLVGVVRLCLSAAVYLTNETTGELREDFRQRALLAGTATAALAAAVVLLAWLEARWFFYRLLSLRTLPVLVAGLHASPARPGRWSRGGML